MHFPTAEAGVRLILVALAAALLGRVASPSIQALPADSPDALWWAYLGIAWTFTAIIGVAGLAGMGIIERNRLRRGLQAGPLWNRSLLAGVVSVAAAGFFFLSWILLGSILGAGLPIVLTASSASSMAIAISVGLFLFWTAERIDPRGRRLRQIALLLGLVAAGTSTTAEMAMWMALRLGPMSVVWPFLALDLLSIVTGALSLVAWILAYGRVLLRCQLSARPAVPSG